MIAAFDVFYFPEGGARVAAVLFEEFSDSSPVSTSTRYIDSVADYIPGKFYLRELPCILALLAELPALRTIVIDGYVQLGATPGLGGHLAQALPQAMPIIGVAKSAFEGAPAIEVLRGNSRNPLFITASGISENEAASMIQSMHGDHRIPTLLRLVDHLCRHG